MPRFVKIDVSDAVSIWKQIENGVRRLAASGSPPAGTPVQSVRKLAKDLRVNPATVSKAYSHLAEAGILIVRRGEGTFFAQRSEENIRLDRQRILSDGARRFAEAALTVKAARAEAAEALDRAFCFMESKMNGGQA